MAGAAISLLSDLHDRSMNFNVEVLVSRIWVYRGATDDGPVQHTDIVVLDKEGTHMFGQLPPGPSEHFKDILEEGKVYTIRRFMCKPSRDNYRAVESPFMMQFTRFSTIVPKPGVEEGYPYCTYNLISFPDIPIPTTQTPRFLDVIGRITTVRDIIVVHSQYRAAPSDTRTIVLQDQSGKQIKLVLWGARAREFEAAEVCAASEVEPVIAIFVGTLPKMYQGTKGLSGNSACRWYINEDLPEINSLRASLPKGLPPIACQVAGEPPLVAAPVREAPVEMCVKELLALDPFDNLKKQFLVKVTITRLGSDSRWWFLSCRSCHKTAYTSGRVYRCSDRTCPSINADPSFCVCTFGSDGTAEAEFMFFDRAAKSLTGKALMTLIQNKYPGFVDTHELVQMGGGDVVMPVEISRAMTQTYSLVVSISNKSFQPTSTELSFQVTRIDHCFKPNLVPLGSPGAAHASEPSSSAGGSNEALPMLASSHMETSMLTILPTDEMHTPLSAFKGKSPAPTTKTPSKSPCPKSVRRKLLLSPAKAMELALPVPCTGLPVDNMESPPTENVLPAIATPAVLQPTETIVNEDEKDLPDHPKTKRSNAGAKAAAATKKAKQ